MTDDESRDRFTRYGFTFGAMEVTRLCELPGNRTVLEVKTPYRTLEIYASTTGRSLRVFDTARSDNTRGELT